jgi:histidinol-phosphate aminotransferase
MKVKDSYNVNRVTQAAGLAALSAEGMKDMKRKIERIRLEKKRLTEALRGLGFSVPESQANFFLASRKGKRGAEKLYKNLKKRRVLVRYFPLPRLRDSLRVTVGTPEQNSRFIAELKKLL